MLAEHRVDNANEGFIAVEKAVPSSEQITFEPAFALVLAEHRIEYASGGREEFIVVFFAGVPLAVGDFEDRAQKIRERFIGTEDAEIPLFLIQLGDIAQKPAQHQRILRIGGAGRRHIHGMGLKVRHAQIAQQHTAVGVRIGAHPAVTFRAPVRPIPA